MDRSHNKNGSAYNLVKYLMGMLLTAFVIFMLAYLLFSCNSDNQTAKLQQHENDIVRIGNVTNLGEITINNHYN